MASATPSSSIMMGDPSSSSGVAAHANSSASILSEKVQRALQIRTDTPAMKSALEALGQLSEKDKKNNNQQGGESFTLDARSVRHAIEYDALQQALLLREELSSLCTSLHDLRKGISETAYIARQVKQAIHTDVVVSSSNKMDGSMLASSSSLDTSSAGNSTNDHEQDEERLASTLADAFSKRNMAKERLQAVHQFLETFDLSESDSSLLDHYNFQDWDLDSNGGAGMAFLKALERVKEIRQALSKTFGNDDTLSSSSGTAASSLGASSALRMMEHLAQKQEQAYERLYHFLQNHLQLYAAAPGSAGGTQQTKKVSFDKDPNVDDDDSDGMDQALQHPFVQAALYTLRHVPAFYRHMLELIASRRRQEETRIFLLALTSGYNCLLPIERLAHDPVAYVGDMLAFAFKSLSTEADVALTIVHYQNNDNSGEEKTSDSAEENDAEEETSSSVDEENYDYTEKPMSGSEILSTSLSGMARPLKSRIMQVVANLASRVDGDSDGESDDGMLDDFEEEGVSVRNKLTNLYDICGLLLFYLSAMRKTVGKLEAADEKRGLSVTNKDSDGSGMSTNALLSNLTMCLVEATRAYDATVRVYSAMLGQLSSSTGDSVATLAGTLISRIAEVRQTSPGFASDVECPVSECDATLSTSWVASKLVEAAMPECAGLDDIMALKKAIQAVKKAGMDAESAGQLDELLEKADMAHVDKLVETETQKVLELCGLGKFVAAWDRWQLANATDNSNHMITNPGLSIEDAEAAMKAFYKSLYSPPLPSLEGVVKDRDMRKNARSKIAESVCSIYEEIYNDMANADKGGYDDISFLGHTPSQVKALFTV